MSQHTQSGPTETNARYVRALRFDLLTPLYDTLLRAMGETRLRRMFVARAGIQPGHRILDVGCGTGTQALLVKHMQPAAVVTGLDGDPRILDIARAKARREAAAVSFELGLSYALPFAGGSFDRVLSSLMLHHLTHPDKERTFREIFRVLRHGGEFHVADWGPPRSLWTRASFATVRRLDGRDVTEDNAEGRLPAMIAAAGFAPVQTTGWFNTLFGTLYFYRASRPAISAPLPLQGENRQ